MRNCHCRYSPTGQLCWKCPKCHTADRDKAARRNEPPAPTPDAEQQASNKGTTEDLIKTLQGLSNEEIADLVANLAKYLTQRLKAARQEKTTTNG